MQVSDTKQIYSYSEFALKCGRNTDPGRISVEQKVTFFADFKLEGPKFTFTLKSRNLAAESSKIILYLTTDQLILA